MIVFYNSDKKGAYLMDQIKIGDFIRERRKKQNLTQKDLAEKLRITDRAISKWENGICLPDTGVMMELCKILDVTINDLFCGKIIDSKDREKQLEMNLLELMRIKEKRDKELYFLELFIGVVCANFMTFCILGSVFFGVAKYLSVLLVIWGILVFAVGLGLIFRIEQVAGYYECQKCHYKFVPLYRQFLFSLSFNRTRYMKCPKCNFKSWNKKVIGK